MLLYLPRSGSGNKAISQPKGDKLLTLSNKIAEHDLQSRLKQIQKWLLKQYKVMVVISGSTSDVAASEHIFKQMDETSKGLGKVLQKRTKGSDIRFQIVPLKEQKLQEPHQQEQPKPPAAATS